MTGRKATLLRGAGRV